MLTPVLPSLIFAVMSSGVSLSDLMPKSLNAFCPTRSTKTVPSMEERLSINLSKLSSNLFGLEIYFFGPDEGRRYEVGVSMKMAEIPSAETVRALSVSSGSTEKKFALIRVCEFASYWSPSLGARFESLDSPINRE